MKSFSALALIVLFFLFSACQKEFVAPTPDAKIVTSCGAVSTNDLLCQKTGAVVGKVSVSNTADIVYLNIENMSNYSNVRIQIKDMTQESNISTYNFVHTEGTRDHLYAFKNNYKVGTPVAFLVEVDCIYDGIDNTTSPFLLHNIQACN